MHKGPLLLLLVLDLVFVLAHLALVHLAAVAPLFEPRQPVRVSVLNRHDVVVTVAVTIRYQGTASVLVDVQHVVTVIITETEHLVLVISASAAPLSDEQVAAMPAEHGVRAMPAGEMICARTAVDKVIAMQYGGGGKTYLRAATKHDPPDKIRTWYKSASYKWWPITRLSLLVFLGIVVGMSGTKVPIGAYHGIQILMVLLAIQLY